MQEKVTDGGFQGLIIESVLKHTHTDSEYGLE